MTEFAKYNASTHPTIKKENDYNNILDHAFEKLYAYGIRKNGSNFEAINGSGADNAGKIDSGHALTNFATLLNHLFTTHSPGAVIFGEGDFLLAGDYLRPSDNVFLCGRGKKTKIYTTENRNLFYIDGKTDVELAYLYLLGTNNPAHTSNVGIAATGNAIRPKVHHCIIEQMGYDGILFNGALGGDASHNHVIDCKDDGINFGGGVPTYLCKAIGNYVHGSASSGIHISDANIQSIVEGNTIEDCGDAGVDFYNSSHNMVQGNIIKNCDYGIRTASGVCSYNQIIANKIYAPATDEAIALTNTPTFSQIVNNQIYTTPSGKTAILVSGDDLLIEGNIIIDSGKHGVNIVAGNRNSIKNNIIRYANIVADCYGITTSETESGIIEGNIIQKAHRGVAGYSKGLHITGNKFFGCERAVSLSYEAQILENYMKDIVDYAIVLSSSDADASMVIGNKINGVTNNTAIFLNNVLDAIITNNKVMGAIGDHAIELAGTTDYAIVLGNNYRGKTVDWGAGTHNIIDHNVS